MQGKLDEAIVKFREGHYPAHDARHLRPRPCPASYLCLLDILEQRKDFAGHGDAVSSKGSTNSALAAAIARTTRDSCCRFVAIPRKRSSSPAPALDQNCEDGESRQILGLASYVKWAATPGPERVESLNQARIYLPAGPMPLYLLSTSDHTLPAAKQLIASGEPVDQQDNDKQTALAYALQKEDLEAAKRLMQLGARADALVGYEGMPVALVPVMEGNVEAVRMMQKAGVDYSKLRFQGMSALDIAKASGNDEIVELLGHHKIAL